MKKQTAVEWLVEQLEQHHTKIDIKNTVVFQQARAMEKNQIQRAFIASRMTIKDEEQYYKETYGS